jgi:hypothetical protein
MRRWRLSYSVALRARYARLMDPDPARNPARKGGNRPPRRRESAPASRPSDQGRGRWVQPQMEAAVTASPRAHGEDRSFDSPPSPPRHDRAG